MSFVSDYKSAPFDLFPTAAPASNYSGTATPPGPGYTGNGGEFNVADYSYDTLCGVKFSTSDGRIVTIVRNAATAIANAGLLLVAPAEITGFEKLAMTVPTNYPATKGATQILVTNGSTVLKENLYAGGYLVTASGTGLGQTLQIASHQAAAASGTFVVTLADALVAGLDATTTVSLVANPYIATVISDAASLTSYPIGVSAYEIPASTAPTWDGTSGQMTAAGTPQYAMVVTHGPQSVLMDSDASAVGYPVGISDLTNGAVGTATLTTQPQIGICMQTSTSAEYVPVYLQL